MTFNYVLLVCSYSSVFYSPKEKLAMAQLRHLEIGIDATGIECQNRGVSTSNVSRQRAPLTASRYSAIHQAVGPICGQYGGLCGPLVPLSESMTYRPQRTNYRSVGTTGRGKVADCLSRRISNTCTVYVTDIRTRW